MNPTSGRDLSTRVWAVAGLLHAVSDLLSARLGTVRVSGEVSALSEAASGHRYFSLKDAQGQPALLRCAMFRRAAAASPVQLRDGLKVEAVGRLAIYEPRGDFQFIIDSIHPVGAGSLFEEFLRLKARLTNEGLFDAARKRPLPEHASCIGVVSSLSAAALRDVLTVIARRAPHIRVVVYPCLVQGAEAPPSIVAALDRATQRGEVDALILARGGGSLEDLWAFNDERVVRAVAACDLPLVCGVGHETDVTLADFAADVRAATPTAAAELLTPVLEDEVDRLDSLRRRMSVAAGRMLDRHSQALDQLSLLVLRPAQSLSQQVHGIERRGARLDAAFVQAWRQALLKVDRQAERLVHAQSRAGMQAAARLHDLRLRLHAQDPGRVLRRGYAWVSGADGVPITSAHGVTPGSQLTAVWADGRANVEVLHVNVSDSGRTGGME